MKTLTNIFHFTLSCLHVNTDGVRAYVVPWFFWSPPGSPRAQGPEGRAVHSGAGDHQAIQGTYLCLSQLLFLPSPVLQTHDGE